LEQPHDSKKRGLAGAVGTDDHNDFTDVDGKVKPEHGIGPVLHADVAQR
jgi:hypothetical protein